MNTASFLVGFIFGMVIMVGLIGIAIFIMSWAYVIQQRRKREAAMEHMVTGAEESVKSWIARAKVEHDAQVKGK